MCSCLMDVFKRVENLTLLGNKAPWPFPRYVRRVVIVEIIAIHKRKETHQLEA